jgi:glycosyltransferase involved in cell wall biosynthesis
MPKVSVVIPVYNAERYLREALESVLAQTLGDIEVICVDDGSTDGSPQILAGFAARDPRVRVLTKPNAGYGAAMNDGIDAARGEYIGVVEADDYIDKTMYERLYTEAVAHDADVCKCDLYATTGSGDDRIAKWLEIAPGSCFYGKVFDGTKGETLYYVVMMTWEGIYRRSFLEENHIRHNETPGASFQDNGFWFVVNALARRYYLINEAHYYYRLDNGGSSIRSAASAMRLPREYHLIRKELERRGLWERLKKTYSDFYFDNLITRLGHIEPDDRTEYQRLIAREWRSLKREDAIDPGLFAPFLLEELEELAQDPDSYVAEEHRSLEEASWDDMLGRHGSGEIHPDDVVCPYKMSSTYWKCLADD